MRPCIPVSLTGDHYKHVQVLRGVTKILPVMTMLFSHVGPLLASLHLKDLIRWRVI
jgi:hypothetical protein